MFRSVKLSKYLARKIVLHNPERSLSKPIVRISVASITLGVAVMILSVCMVDGFKKETIRQIRKFFPDIVIMPKNTEGTEWNYVRVSSDSVALASEYFKGISFHPFIQKTALLRYKDQSEGLILKGIGKGHPAMTEIQLVKGRWFHDSAGQKTPEMLLPRTFAASFGIDTGTVCRVYFLVKSEAIDSASGKLITSYVPKSRRFRVCGWYDNVGSDAMAEPAFTGIHALQKINRWEDDFFSGFEIINYTTLKNPHLGSELSAYFFHAYSILPMETRLYSFFIWLEKLDINGMVVIGLMAVVCIVNAMMALLILIIEHVREIGLLKTFGMSHSGIRDIFFFVAWHILARGILLGNLLGLLLAFLQWKYHFVTLDPATYYINHVAIGWNFKGIVLINLGLTAICMLTLMLPTRYITGIMPFRILRYE
ncbi:MAG: ABC transporter permease [Bacteroidia bacterium]|nr:ABC transporter permease [Bacteroidia bacterium]